MKHFPFIVIFGMITLPLFISDFQMVKAAPGDAGEPFDTTYVDGGELDSSVVSFRWPSGSGEQAGYTKQEVSYLSSVTVSHGTGWNVGGGINGGATGGSGGFSGGYSWSTTVDSTYSTAFCCMPVGGKCNFDYQDDQCDTIYMP